MTPSQPQPQSFECPRCARAVEQRFYGPCGTCREDLIASQAGESRQLRAERFEPKMNVVPNQVATKE